MSVVPATDLDSSVIAVVFVVDETAVTVRFARGAAPIGSV